MVKIRDLTEKQLLSQIEKYEKIYTQLLAEREKRVRNGADLESLKTSAEKTADKIRQQQAKQKQKLEAQIEEDSPVVDESTAAYHLKIDESELSSLNAQDDNVEAEDEEEEEEVRVTQLLQLSKEQLEELRGGGEKKETVKKGKKSLFGRKKKGK